MPRHNTRGKRYPRFLREQHIYNRLPRIHDEVICRNTEEFRIAMKFGRIEMRRTLKQIADFERNVLERIEGRLTLALADAMSNGSQNWGKPNA